MSREDRTARAAARHARAVRQGLERTHSERLRAIKRGDPNADRLRREADDAHRAAMDQFRRDYPGA